LGLTGIHLEYLKHYTPEDIEYLKKNYAATSWEEMMFVLGRKKESITLKAGKLGLKRAQRPCVWTSSEEEFLRENYSTMTGSEIGEKLGKSSHSIYHKSARLGLVK
jgi:hypothetical protein